MNHLFSYIIRHDAGAAPNPFWGICTLTICKPTIRRTAIIGDWIVGTGSKNAICNDKRRYDLSDSVVYAMKISDVKTLSEYDLFCRASMPQKIPNWKTSDWRLRMGDCIYDFSQSSEPLLRKSVHDERSREKDLSGLNALISDYFVYFGEEARPLPEDMRQIIKRGQGHLKIKDPERFSRFETWIKQFKRNKIYADPQNRFKFDREMNDYALTACATQLLEEDEDEAEGAIF